MTQTSMHRLLFLYGADTYRSFEKLRAIQQRYREKAAGDTNLVTLASDMDSMTFMRHVQALPFLATTRLVIVRNLCLEGQKQLQDAIADLLPKIPSSTVVLFYESGSPDRRTRLFKLLKTTATATEYPLLSVVDRTRWLKQQLEDTVGSAPAEVVTYLGETIGSDLWRAINEIEKLRLFLQDRPMDSLTRQELEALLPASPMADIFTLIDACVGQRPRQAFEELDRLLDQGENELYLLSMLQFGFRSLVLIVDAREQGHRTTSDISRSTGVNPYVVGKYLPHATRLSSPTLVEMYGELLETDAAIKTGRSVARDALERLLLVLTKTLRSRQHSYKNRLV